MKRYGSFTAVDGINLGVTRPTEREILLFDERCSPQRLDLAPLLVMAIVLGVRARAYASGAGRES